jgi:hypothetical protein
MHHISQQLRHCHRWQRLLLGVGCGEQPKRHTMAPDHAGDTWERRQMDGGAIATTEKERRGTLGEGRERRLKKLEIRTIAVEVDGFPIAVAHGEGLRAEGGWVVGGFGMRERGEKGDKGETIVRPGTKTALFGEGGCVCLVWDWLGTVWYSSGGGGIDGLVRGAWCVVRGCGRGVRVERRLKWSRFAGLDVLCR